MDQKEIKQLLQSHRRSEGGHGFRCPEENRLAAYVDGQLTAEARTTLENHVTDCNSCLEGIAFLARSAEWTNTNAIPAYLIARARGLVTEKPPVSVWRWRWAMATAAAAFVVVAVIFV